jgi:hypothetical protein
LTGTLKSKKEDWANERRASREKKGLQMNSCTAVPTFGYLNKSIENYAAGRPNRYRIRDNNSSRDEDPETDWGMRLH